MRKFSVTVGDRFSLAMPKGAEPLHFAEQGGRLWLWARVDPSLPTVARRFRLAGTGHLLEFGVGAHVGTVALAGGSLIFHLFDCGEADDG